MVTEFVNVQTRQKQEIHETSFTYNSLQDHLQVGHHYQLNYTKIIIDFCQIFKLSICDNIYSGYSVRLICLTLLRLVPSFIYITNFPYENLLDCIQMADSHILKIKTFLSTSQHLSVQNRCLQDRKKTSFNLKLFVRSGVLLFWQVFF